MTKQRLAYAEDTGRTEAPVAKRLSTRTQLLLVVLIPIIVASLTDHLIANVIGYGIGATYRRVGPATGPQVFCAGSSVLQYSLAWPDISKQLGQGIEHTNVAGSSPEIWETFQRQAKNVNLTIVGISAHDLNEYRMSKGFAYFVPLTQTINDIRESGAPWQVSRRVLSEYPMAYLRMLFPTAGDSDVFLVGLRRVVRKKLGLSGATEDEARVLALPKNDLLDFGEDEQKLSDMPRDRVLRRLSLLRIENRGMLGYNGPQQAALHRILDRGRQQGRVVIVVLPVSRDYVQEFLTPTVKQDFEDMIARTQRYIPEATVVRLDRISALESDENFTDFVHMNSGGRAIATRAFLEQLQGHSDQSSATR